jgi:solute carrier family 50 protein (sugar transporter)
LKVKVERVRVPEPAQRASKLDAEGALLASVAREPPWREIAMGFVIETVFPTLGVFLANTLYLAPLPAVRQAHRQAQLGGLNPTPLALMALNTIGFLAYGLAVPNRYVVASNIFGVPLAIWYLVTVLPLARDESILSQLKLVIVGGAFFLSAEMTYVRLGLEDVERAGMMGMFATFVCIAMFAAPLSTVAEVLSTRSSASLYGPLTIAQVCNCTLWTVYGFAVNDVWVYGSNGTGLVLGLLQAGLIVMFPSKGAPPSPEEGKAILKDFSQVGLASPSQPPSEASV